MKTLHQTCNVSKRTVNRPEGSIFHSQPFNLLHERSRPPSWQHASKRKFQSSAHEPLPQARKPENMLHSSQGVRSTCMRKSLSDPLQVFSDGDASDPQHSNLSGAVRSDSKDRLLRDCQGQHDMIEAQNLSRERRRGYKQGLKDSTNLDPQCALKQKKLPACSTGSEVFTLKEALRAEKEAFQCLRAELDEERNAARSAANEAIAMIARLQEEKAAVLMEARQFKRMAEERELHNQEAISLLKDMLVSKEEEASALENELATCRQIFLAIDAGEPIDRYELMHFEGGGFGGRSETEPHSAQVEGGLKNWTSSFYDSKLQLTVCGTNLSREALYEEPLNSEFRGRRHGRSFKDFVSDNIRGNLESFFDQAGKPLEGSPLDTHSEMVSSRTLDSTKDSDMEKRFLKRNNGVHSPRGKENCEDSPKVKASPSSSGKSFMGSQDDLAIDRSLLERIMRLEQRIEAFEVGERNLELELEARTAAASSQTPAAKFPVGQLNLCNWETMYQDGCCSQDLLMKGEDSAERPTKLQCREGSHGRLGLQTSFCKQQVLTSKQKQPLEVTSMNYGCYSNEKTVKESFCEEINDIAKCVHDIYEVDYHLYQTSPFPLPNPPVDECIRTAYTNSPHEQSCSPTELMTPDLETMDVESHASPPVSTHEQNASLSSSGAEAQHLASRLQALESEKEDMHRTILSLKRENEELKLLQVIAQELQDLKRHTNLKRSAWNAEHPNKRAKSEPPYLSSLLKGFLSYLPSSKSSESSCLANPSCYQDRGLEAVVKDHMGLSYLLDKSPYVKTSVRLLLRDLKVKVPPAIYVSLK